LLEARHRSNNEGKGDTVSRENTIVTDHQVLLKDKAVARIAASFRHADAGRSAAKTTVYFLAAADPGFPAIAAGIPTLNVVQPVVDSCHVPRDHRSPRYPE
jgi:hypothetical protein